MRDYTIRHEPGKHFSPKEIAIIIATANHNITLRKPLSHRKLAKKLYVSPSSLSDIIQRAQVMSPARYGNKKIQYYPLSRRKLDARRAAVACRYAAANRTPEVFFEELRKEMSKKGKDGRSLKGKVTPASALRNIKKQAEVDPEYARKECVISALAYLMTTNKLGKVTAILSDNGSEFRNWRAIEAIVHAKLYYTFAYSAWQKGSVERYNLQLRERFFPKGTDFSKFSRQSINAAVDHINHLVRTKSPKGLTAYDAFSTRP